MTANQGTHVVAYLTVYDNVICLCAFLVVITEVHLFSLLSGCTEDIMTSDHSPVFATFQVGVTSQFVSKNSKKYFLLSPPDRGIITSLVLFYWIVLYTKVIHQQ